MIKRIKFDFVRFNGLTEDELNRILIAHHDGADQYVTEWEYISEPFRADFDSIGNPAEILMHYFLENIDMNANNSEIIWFDGKEMVLIDGLH